MGRFVRLAGVSEMSEGKLMPFKVDGEKVLAVNLQGKFYAVSDRCTHMGCPLHSGRLDDKELTCACHYAKFDITTGEVRGPPANRPLKTYNLQVKDADLLIEL